MSKRSAWKKIGVIGVDAGLCWIGDPCYILGDDGRPESVGKDWRDFCNKTFEGREGQTAEENAVTQFNFDKGHAGLGVAVSTGFGDGMYDVEARFVTVKGESRRLAEVRVVFISEEEK